MAVCVGTFATFQDGSSAADFFLASASSGLDMPTSRSIFPMVRTTGCIDPLLTTGYSRHVKRSSPTCYPWKHTMTISSTHSIKSLHFSLAVLLALTASVFAQDKPKPEPDVIVFTNGDQLTGTVERGAGDSVVFRSDMAGEITVPFAKIKELRAHGQFALLRKDTKTPTTNVQEGMVAYSSSMVTLTTAHGGTVTVAPNAVDFLIDKPTYDKQVAGHVPLWSGWKGAVTGGATFVRSTQNGSTFTAGASLVRAIPLVSYLPPKSRSIFNLTETYGKLTQPVVPQPLPPAEPIPDTVIKTNIFVAGFEQDEYFSPRFYALGHANFNHDYSQGLDLQQVYGGGFGWTAIKQPKQELDLKADIHYEKQHFFSPVDPSTTPATPDQNLIGSTISELYHRNLPKGIVFNQNLDALPAFNNSNAYSGDISAGIVLPVYKRLGANFTATDNFLNNPAPGFKKNSFQFVTGVTYTLP